MRKVGNTTNVVDVKVRDHDVPDIGSAEAELLDLANGGFVAVEHWPDEVARRPEPPRGVGDVVQAKAGVYEDQTVGGLDEQDVADLRGTGGVDAWCRS